MNRNAFKPEILQSWSDAVGLREKWDALASAATNEHPFFSFDWFEFFYRFYVPPDKIRIIVIKDQVEQLRALLPGFTYTLRKRGLNIPCFSFAANGYTKYGGVIADPSDHDAIRQALFTAINFIEPNPIMLVMPYIPDNSSTGLVIRGNTLGAFARRIEHDDVVISFSMPGGWEKYLSSRTRSTRNRIKGSLSRSKKLDRFSFEYLDSAGQSKECIERLRRLDALTWQGQQGTGLFSTPENERFYNELLRFAYPDLCIRVYFTVIDGKDVAYSLTLAGTSTRLVMKLGYDPAFASYRPGVLTMVNVCNSSLQEGLWRIDYGIGDIGDKGQWETERQKIVNWWLINRDRLRGRMLEWALKWYDKRSKKETFI